MEEVGALEENLQSTIVVLEFRHLAIKDNIPVRIVATTIMLEVINV